MCDDAEPIAARHDTGTTHAPLRHKRPGRPMGCGEECFRRPVICASSPRLTSAVMASPAAALDHPDDEARATQLARQRLMRACAKAAPVEIDGLLTNLGEMPAATDLRRPEVGLVMLRGRIGGDGSAFNVGEATVARAAIRLETGAFGFGCRLGRSVEAARMTAIADALIQSDGWRARVIAGLVEPLEVRQKQARVAEVEETASTRVEFFTMSRGSE